MRGPSARGVLGRGVDLDTVTAAVDHENPPLGEGGHVGGAPERALLSFHVGRRPPFSDGRDRRDPPEFTSRPRQDSILVRAWSGREQLRATEFADELGRDTEHVEVHDVGTGGAVDDVDDSSEERLIGVARDDDVTHADPRRVVGFLQHTPDVPGLVDLMHIRGKRDVDGGAGGTGQHARLPM